MVNENVPQYFRGKVLVRRNCDSIFMQSCSRLIAFGAEGVENMGDLRIEVIDLELDSRDELSNGFLLGNWKWLVRSSSFK